MILLFGNREGLHGFHDILHSMVLCRHYATYFCQGFKNCESSGYSDTKYNTRKVTPVPNALVSTILLTQCS